jgi:hypothetical protein
MFLYQIHLEDKGQDPIYFEADMQTCRITYGATGPFAASLAGKYINIDPKLKPISLSAGEPLVIYESKESLTPIVLNYKVVQLETVDTTKNKVHEQWNLAKEKKIYIKHTFLVLCTNGQDEAIASIPFSSRAEAEAFAKPRPSSRVLEIEGGRISLI